MKRIIAVVIVVAFAPPVLAGSLESVSPAGRYALTAADCKAGDIFATVTERLLALPTYACKGVEYDQTESKGGRALYSVTAKSCVGEEGRAKPDRFTLAVESETLQILWSDGTKSARLARCGAKGVK
jgi:hypothetical protein